MLAGVGTGAPMLPWLLLLMMMMTMMSHAGELLVSLQSSQPALVLAMGGHRLHPAPKGTGRRRGFLLAV